MSQWVSFGLLFTISYEKYYCDFNGMVFPSYEVSASWYDLSVMWCRLLVLTILHYKLKNKQPNQQKQLYIGNSWSEIM